jgi:predicted nucleotide-binding protein
MNDVPSSRGEASMIAVVPDAIADDLVADGLVEVVPGLRGPVLDAALVATSAGLGGATVVALRQIPDVGRRFAERLATATHERGQSVEVRIRRRDDHSGTSSSDVTLVLNGRTDLAAVADLVDAISGPRPTRGLRPSAPDPSGGRKVFVIHGRDMEATQAIFSFLRDIGLAPQEWEMLVQANGNPLPTLTDVVVNGLAPGATDVVVAVLTPDDIVVLHEDLHHDDEHWFEVNKQMQPRPDVLIEIGLALAAYRERLVIVELGPPLRRISNLDGLNVIRFDNVEPEIPMGQLVQRLRLAGCAVDESGTEWRRTARFRDLACYKRRPE